MRHLFEGFKYLNWRDKKDEPVINKNIYKCIQQLFEWIVEMTATE